MTTDKAPEPKGMTLESANAICDRMYKMPPEHIGFLKPWDHHEFERARGFIEGVRWALGAEAEAVKEVKNLVEMLEVMPNKLKAEVEKPC